MLRRTPAIPRLPFTTQRLEKLACPAGKDRLYVHDAKTLGLVCCTTSTGTQTFYVARRVNGKPVRIRLGQFPSELSVDTARKEAAKVNGDIAKGVDPTAAKRAGREEPTFGLAWSTYFERHAKVHKRTWQGDESQYEKHLRRWQNRKLSQITRGDVQGLHARIGKESGPYAANRALALLHCIFAKATELLGWEKPNPAHKVQRFREQSRERFLQADELPKFFKALLTEPDETFRDFFLLCLFTGARRGNVASMAWTDVHLDRAVWTIPETKSGEPVTVPLSPEAVAVLRTRQEKSDGSPWVFPSRGRSGHVEEPKGVWQRILDRAGIKDLRIHDLRRTLGSWQAATGASLPIIGKSLGHKNQSTTAIYARLNLDPVRDSVNVATAAMLTAANGGKA